MNCPAATASKSNMTRKTSKPDGFTVTEILIAVVLIVSIVATVIVLGPIRLRASSTQACISNLRLIDSAKHAWALEQRKRNTDTPAISDIQPYVGRGVGHELPLCPNDPPANIQHRLFAP